jgi:hypothetical protein
MADKNKEAQELKGILGEVNAALKEMEAHNKVIKDGFAATKNSLSSLVDLASQYNAHQSRTKELSADQLKNLSEKLKAEKETLKLSQESLDKQIQKNIAEKKSNEQEVARLNLLNKTQGIDQKRQKQIEKLIASNKTLKNVLIDQEAIYSQAQDTLDDIDGSIGDIEKGLDRASKGAKGLEMLKKVGGSLDKISSPLDGMLNPLNLINKLFSFIVGSVTEYDKRLGDTAKSMNITYDEADKSNKAMAAFAKSSKSAYDNSEDLNKTVVDLNKNLGTSIKFEQLTGALKEDVALMSQLENIAGLTSEETQGILNYTLATGQSATKATKDLMANYKVAGLKRGVVLNEKEALKEVSKLSNSIKLSTAGGAAGLGKAVAAAKALGTDLGKVDDIAGSILNFEESIEAELSAELLTGKNLNLEKAREAALNNDLATLSDEIAKNVGKAADFNKMNRIQQDAIAKSVGMSREELATTLTNQEALKNIGASSLEQAQEQYNLAKAEGKEKEFLDQLGDKSLAKQFEQTSMQEEAANAQKQANDSIILAIGSMVKYKDELKAVLKFATKLADNFGLIKGILVAMGLIMVGKLVKGILDFAGGTKQAIGIAKSLFAIEKKEAAVNVVGDSYKMAAGLGPLGIAAVGGLIGAGLTALAMYTMNDGIIGPSGGSGYGDRTLFGPEGAISFNNKDTIVAGTDLFKADDMVSAPKGAVQVSSGNNSSREIAELRNAIMALASRPVNVSIDGKRVIEATTGNNPNTQGVESAKNSFKMQ